MTGIQDLIDKVEAGTVYETMGHTRLCQKVFPPRFEGDHGKDSLAQLAVNAWNRGSLDAVKALHDSVLPGWIVVVYTRCHLDDEQNPTVNLPSGWQVGLANGLVSESERIEVGSGGDCLARCWLLCVLKAMKEGN